MGRGPGRRRRAGAVADARGYSRHPHQRCLAWLA